MIVYIIRGKTKSIQAAVDYVCDEKKTAKKFDEIRSEYELSPELQENISYQDYLITCEDNINRALNYIANEDKIGGYISGYLCDPEFCEEQFITTKRINLGRVGKNLEDDNGNFFYHIIQSFPEGLEISDDEVHRCGVELVERLGLYQAIVTSHIHPTIDEEGEVRGKCKHNHILINSHIYHNFIDENNPHKMKYHLCNESYAQLQLINDQIAIEHGLPIIEKPDIGKVYSWFESKENNEGKSWKSRVKIDISNAMRVSENLDDYIESMQAAGYKVRFGKSKNRGDYISYTCPEPDHVVRDYILGKGYSLPDLQSFWEIKRSINEDLLDNCGNAENKMTKLLENTSEAIFIKLKKSMSERRKENLRERNMNTRNSYTKYLPITSTKAFSPFELSYIDPDKTYEIVNERHHTITEVSGQEILEYYHIVSERLRREKEEEEKRRKEEQARAAYTNPRFIKTSTREPYKIRMYDERGHKRSLIELILILAVVTIENEYGKWQPSNNPEYGKVEYTNNPIYAKREWKMENMIKTVQIAEEENIKTPSELEERIKKAGKEGSKAKAEVHRLTDAKNKMETLFQAIDGYNEVKEICENIHAMPDGPEKSKLQEIHAEEIEEYKMHRATMYRFKATSEESIQDFKERYEIIVTNLQRAENQNQKYKEEYTRLMKLKYNIQLAQNKQYCYGPEFKELLDTQVGEAQRINGQQKFYDNLDSQHR